MDGNGRWAKARGLPRAAGHRGGVEALRRTVRAAGDLGIEWLTVYAFSSDISSRPQAEVPALSRLLELLFRPLLRRIQQAGVRVMMIGGRERFAPRLRALVDGAEALTALNKAMNRVIAFN